MADATDLFRKGKSNFATTLASGISDSDTTIPLSSAVGLPTDTAVTLTIDRVDSNGDSTTPKVERVTGVVSSTNLVSCLRGEDGTTPSAHEAGAVVEMIWDGETWNDAVGGILAEHNQDGTHKDVSLGDSSDFLVEHNANGTHANVSLENSDDFKVEHNADGTHKINTFQHLYTPEGFLINGKIVPSVSSNNLTVAIKGMDGNDPSATNPVYVRIGDSIRSITSSLSITLNAGTNWFNSGGARFATFERDYFVYLVLNGSNIRLAFTPRPDLGVMGTTYKTSDTSTNISYVARSGTISSGDIMVNIGRFGATLSAGAGYTWSVPTFVNNVNIIQRPIYESRLLRFATSYSGTESMTVTVDFSGPNSYKQTMSNMHILISDIVTIGGTPSYAINIECPYPAFPIWDGSDDVGYGGNGIFSFNISCGIYMPGKASLYPFTYIIFRRADGTLNFGSGTAWMRFQFDYGY